MNSYVLPVVPYCLNRKGWKADGTAAVVISFPKAWLSIHIRAYPASTKPMPTGDNP